MIECNVRDWPLTSNFQKLCRTEFFLKKLKLQKNRSIIDFTFIYFTTIRHW